jgi:hypothetical protein
MVEVVIRAGVGTRERPDESPSFPVRILCLGTSMRPSVAAMILLALGLLHAELGHGQVLKEPASVGPPVEMRAHYDLSPPLSMAVPIPTHEVNGEPSYGQVLFGTGLGAVLGGAVGAGVGHVLWGEPADYTMIPGLGLASGAILGSVPGMYLGARWASGRAGHPVLTGAAAVGGAALGVLVGGVVYDAVYQRDGAKAPAVLGLALGVSVSLNLTSLAEWRVGVH